MFAKTLIISDSRICYYGCVWCRLSDFVASLGALCGSLLAPIDLLNLVASVVVWGANMGVFIFFHQIIKFFHLHSVTMGGCNVKDVKQYMRVC